MCIKRLSALSLALVFYFSSPVRAADLHVTETLEGTGSLCVIVPESQKFGAYRSINPCINKDTIKWHRGNYWCRGDDINTYATGSISSGAMSHLSPLYWNSEVTSDSRCDSPDKTWIRGDFGQWTCDTGKTADNSDNACRCLSTAPNCVDDTDDNNTNPPPDDDANNTGGNSGDDNTDDNNGGDTTPPDDNTGGDTPPDDTNTGDDNNGGNSSGSGTNWFNAGADNNDKTRSFSFSSSNTGIDHSKDADGDGTPDAIDPDNLGSCCDLPNMPSGMCQPWTAQTIRTSVVGTGFGSYICYDSVTHNSAINEGEGANECLQGQVKDDQGQCVCPETDNPVGFCKVYDDHLEQIIDKLEQQRLLDQQQKELTEQTNQKLDTTNDKLDSTNDKLDGLNQKIGENTTKLQGGLSDVNTTLTTIKDELLGDASDQQLTGKSLDPVIQSYRDSNEGLKQQITETWKSLTSSFSNTFSFGETNAKTCPSWSIDTPVLGEIKLDTCQFSEAFETIKAVFLILCAVLAASILMGRKSSD